MSRHLWKLLASLPLSLCFAASGAAQSASPAALVDNFVKAWNSHEGKAFDRLFADDAILVPLAELMVESRSVIVKGLAETHADWAKITTVVPSAIETRTLRPDVAIVLFHLMLTGNVDEQGKPLPGTDRAVIFVAVKQSR